MFLLLLCLTGLPLIFHHEIDEVLGYAPTPAVSAPGTPKAMIDAIGAAAVADHPGAVLLYLSWDKDEPGLVTAFTNATVTSDPNTTVVKAFDAVTARPLGLVGAGPMLVVMRLHVDMYAGLPGKLFLGAMGVLMVVAIISGVVLYWPFTRRLDFATLRDSKSARVRWLDWHNLLGAVTIAWAVVVGLTGTINTLADPMLNAWKATDLTEMVKPFAGQPPPLRLASLDRVVDNAKAAAPGMDVQFIAFPGTPFSSSHHFAAFMRGDTALTARLYKPVLLDGDSGEAVASRDLPVYLKALLVSQPLHFGDYGGMPLKIIWALLDVMTIVVLGSGLYLWWAKRTKRQRGQRLAARSVGRAIPR